MAVTVSLFGFWAFNSERLGILQSVPKNTTGDEPDYDCIACQLRSNFAFAVNYQDPGFLAPYQKAVADGDARPGFAEGVVSRRPGLTTYRPPLLPAVLAATYPEDLSGRNFVFMRLINLAAAAATAGLAAWCVRCSVGALASLACLGLICYVGGLQSYAALILTESLCGLFVTVAWASLALGLPRRPLTYAAAAGAAWGAAMLTRTSMVLWVPAIACGIWSIARLPRPEGGRASFRRAATTAACYVAIAVALFVPWGLRNISVSQSFLPLGCQGLVELPTGFSDAAVENRGVWVPLNEPALGGPELSLPDVERLSAERGRARAMRWVSGHPSALGRLTIDKIWSEWKPRSIVASFVLFAAGIGLLCYRKTPFAWSCAFVLIGDTLMIAATWSVEGRFTYPAVAAQYALAGAGIWALLRLVTSPRDVDRC